MALHRAGLAGGAARAVAAKAITIAALIVLMMEGMVNLNEVVECEREGNKSGRSVQFLLPAQSQTRRLDAELCGVRHDRPIEQHS